MIEYWIKQNLLIQYNTNIAIFQNIYKKNKDSKYEAFRTDNFRACLSSL